VAELEQLIANGLVTGSVIAVAAAGVSLVYGILRIVMFAYGELLTLGAYAAVLANVRWHERIAVSAAIAILATAALAVALEFVLWRPLRRRGAGFMSLFIVSIGLALVLRHVLFLIAGAEPRAYLVDPFKVYAFWDVRLAGAQGVAIVLAVVGIALLGIVLARMALGRSLRAVSDDPTLASVSGVNVDRVAVVTWALAGALAGLGGVLQGLVQYSFTPSMGFSLLLPIFAAVVLGGIGSAYGALAGGLALGLAMEVSTWTSLHGGIEPVYKPVVAFAVLVLALLLRPQGLFGRARVL
jgi:branched-chain amino acid transport system permease protein